MKMRTKWLAAAVAAIGVQCCMAQTDTLLMKVGRIGVSRAEFEYAYHKNGAKMAVEDFLKHYILVKRKVNEACALGLDTAQAFRREMAHYKAAIAAPSPKEAIQADTLPQQSTGEGEWIAHLCVRVPQSATSAALRKVQGQLNSFYADSLATTDLEEWIERNAAHLPAGWQAEIVYVAPSKLTNDMGRQLQSLQVGQVSHPFVTAVGVHMVQRLDSVEVQEQVVVPPRVLPGNVGPLLQEYHDGLLVALLDGSEPRPTPQELESYFKKHKKQYSWKLPHFKGMVLQSNDQERLEQLVRYLKGFRQEEWDEALLRFDKDGGKGWLKVEKGLWQIGHNAAVDKFFFKQGNHTPAVDYPYVEVLGKKLKKRPENYTDVLPRVEADYTKFRQQKEAQAWGKKFKVEINQEVLKTVKPQEAI